MDKWKVMETISVIISQHFKIPCDMSAFPSTPHLLALSSALLLISTAVVVINSHPLPTPVLAGSKVESSLSSLLLLGIRGVDL